MAAIKLNVGSGPRKIPGFTNLDGLPWDGATDIVHDLTKIPYPIKTDRVAEIVMQECLEHISFRKTDVVLAELYRILMPGGTIRIQVPDCGKAMHYYVNQELCACVPLQGRSPADFKADPNCDRCGGRAKQHPQRWIDGFTGHQRHRFDAHLNLFTEDRLRTAMQRARFRDIHFHPDPNKLIARAMK